MPDKYKTQRVICRDGMFTTENTLHLATEHSGAATRLLNYEPSVYGGYRRIEGFAPYDTSSTEIPGTGATLGCFIFNDTVFGARSTTGAIYSVYKYTTGLGWGTAVNVLSTGSVDTRTSTGVARLRVVRHNYEGSQKITVLDGVNFPATYSSGGTWSVITSATSIGAADVLGARWARNFKRHMAYTGMPGALANLVVISAPTDHDNFAAAAGALAVNVGFQTKGLAVFRGALYVFGESQIKKITGNNSSDFAVEDVTESFGTVSGDSIVEVGGDVIYWSQDGIRLISGTDKIGDVNLETVSENVKSTLLEYPEQYDLSNVVATIVRNKTQVRFFIYSSSDAESSSVGVIGGKRYSTGENPREWEFGDLLGIQANCADSHFIDGKEVVVHGSNNGFVHRQENGDRSFNGADIVSVYSTPYLDDGNTETMKDWHSLHLFFRSEGRFTLNVGASLTWDDPSYELPANFTRTITAVSSIYNDLAVKYDDTAVVYDGYGRNSVRINLPCTAPSIRLTYVSQSSTDYPHSIQGFVLRYIENDMRLD